MIALSERKETGPSNPAGDISSKRSVFSRQTLIFGAIAAVTDITRIKKRQPEYRNLVQLNTEAVLIIDKDYSIVFAHPASEHIFGRSSEELTGVPGILTKNTGGRSEGMI